MNKLAKHISDFFRSFGLSSEERNLRSQIRDAYEKLAVYGRSGDYSRAAEIQHQVLPELEQKLKQLRT